MKRRLWIVMSVLFAVITAAAVLSACKTRAAGAEAGTYYCESNGDEYTLTLNQDCTYDMAIAGETGKGEYTIEGEVLTLEPSQGGGAANGVIEGRYADIDVQERDLSTSQKDRLYGDV